VSLRQRVTQAPRPASNREITSMISSSAALRLIRHAPSQPVAGIPITLLPNHPFQPEPEAVLPLGRIGIKSLCK